MSESTSEDFSDSDSDQEKVVKPQKKAAVEIKRKPNEKQKKLKKKNRDSSDDDSDNSNEEEQPEKKRKTLRDYLNEKVRKSKYSQSPLTSTIINIVYFRLNELLCRKQLSKPPLKLKRFKTQQAIPSSIR